MISKNYYRDDEIYHLSLSEGLGSLYERLMVKKLFEDLEDKYKFSTVLEYKGLSVTKGLDNITYLKKGKKVALYDDKYPINWSYLNIKEKPEIVKKLGKKEKYDLVWNFAQIQLNDKNLDEMTSHSNKYVMAIVPNVVNWGTPIHLLYHLLTGSNCRHPERGSITVRTMCGLKKEFEKRGLKIVKSGYVDIPLLPDIGFSIAELKHSLGIKTQKKEGNVDSGKLQELMFRLGSLERSKINPLFKIPFAHHMYVLAEKNNRDNEFLTSFLKRNLPAMAPTFDEGIGIASERYFMALFLDGIVRRSKNSIKKVLEVPVDGSMGIPGLNSVPFARRGASVTISAPYKPVLDNAGKFWRKLGLGKSVKTVYDPKLQFPFKDKGFDLVWNSCLFEHLSVNSLLPEMKRISRKYVLIVGQNIYNWGYPIHVWYHKKNRQTWDHGYPELMRVGNVKNLVSGCGLKIIESGFIDSPPWLDTFDMHTRGLGKKLVTSGDKWYWSALRAGDMERLSRSNLIKLLDIFQKLLIFPLNYIFAHHYYILAEVKS